MVEHRQQQQQKSEIRGGSIKIDGEGPIKSNKFRRRKERRTDKKCRKLGNLMSMAGAKCDFVNTEGIDGHRSFAFLVVSPCPYNVGGCIDGGRGGFALKGYNNSKVVGDFWSHKRKQ
jgi:hypothetical protein